MMSDIIRNKWTSGDLLIVFSQIRQAVGKAFVFLSPVGI